MLTVGKIPTNKMLTWKSSDSSIISVDSTGKVTAKAPGKATITATAADGTGVSASVEIEVVQPIKSISLIKSKTISIDEEIDLAALVLPEDITMDGIIIVWSKSDRNGYIEFEETDVMKKDAKGNLLSTGLERDENGNLVSKISLKGMKKGTGTITLTITTKDGTYKKVVCSVSVK